LLYGFLLGTDHANDPTITIYDNASAATGEELVPTCDYDASLLGINGFMPGAGLSCVNGIYIEITTAGACEATVFFTPLPRSGLIGA
jgi:hypothetical protein